jgi:hypothetical protein
LLGREGVSSGILEKSLTVKIVKTKNKFALVDLKGQFI